jgi:hypothetical protein
VLFSIAHFIGSIAHHRAQKAAASKRKLECAKAFYCVRR